MTSIALGDFLVRRGLLTQSQVRAAQERQRALRPVIGLLAQQEGVLSMDQTMNVLGVQATSDQSFGAVAIELGYLTEDQMEQLLRLQMDTPGLGEILLQMGTLTRAKLGEAQVELEECARHARTG